MGTIKRILVALVALMASVLLLPASTASAAEATCSRPASDADSISLFPLPYADPHLTIAIRVSPQAPPEYTAAIYGAIHVWQGVLQQCFDGAVTLTITQDWAKADIRLNYVPMWNPNVGGLTLVLVNHGGAAQHSTIFLKSDYPRGQLGADNIEPVQYFYMSALHEIGHALGLGHAEPLLTSDDLMAYGEFIQNPQAPEPILSQCDVDALAATWTAHLAGEGPASTYQC
jgi:hypothetical protein